MHNVVTFVFFVEYVLDMQIWLQDERGKARKGTSGRGAKKNGDQT